MASVRERTPGHFEIRAYVGRDVDGRKVELVETYVHHRKDGGVRDARELGRKLDERAAKMRHARGTFGDLLAQWLAQAEALGRSPNTLQRYRGRVAIITEVLGPLPLLRLTTKDLDRWYGELVAQGKSPANVAAYHRIVRAALNQGERWEMVDRNVATRATLPIGKRAEKHTPTSDQVRQLATLAERSRVPEMGWAIVVAAATGLRRGELAGLRWHDVTWPTGVEPGSIHVRRSVYDVDGQIGEKTTKGRQDRHVTVPTVAIAALERQLKAQQADATALGLSAEVNGYVFAGDEVGSAPSSPNRFTRNFDLLRARAVAEFGGVWPFRFHDLRRYTATELLKAGVPIHVVAAILGHAQTATTSDIYADVRPEQLGSAAVVLNGALED